MLTARREQDISHARKMMRRPSDEHRHVVVPPNWWKLIEGYRENPFEDLARCVSSRYPLQSWHKL